MLAIAPTSGIFDAAAGTAENSSRATIDAAVTMRAPLIRCVSGTLDRRTAGGIERTSRGARRAAPVRSRVTDAGLKIAIENHSGDMQARELEVVDRRGGDAISLGVCIDSGNAAWAIEDPHDVSICSRHMC